MLNANPSRSLLAACQRSARLFAALLLLALAPLALSHVDANHLHIDDSPSHCELCLNQGAVAGPTAVTAVQLTPTALQFAARSASRPALQPFFITAIRGPPLALTSA